MSNRKKTKMTAEELRQLEADWERVRLIEAMALFPPEQARTEAEQ